jgi:hypothetical protein
MVFSFHAHNRLSKKHICTSAFLRTRCATLIRRDPLYGALFVCLRAFEIKHLHVHLHVHAHVHVHM